MNKEISKSVREGINTRSDWGGSMDPNNKKGAEVRKCIPNFLSCLEGK